MEQNENQTVQNGASSTQDVSKKSRLAALLFAFFLGNLGIHDIYVGRVGRGVAKIIMSVLSIIMYIVAFSTMIPFLTGEYDVSGYTTDSMLKIFMPAIILLVIALIVLFTLGIWVLVDIILCATGNFKDKDGKKITLWESNK